ncbi:unnamed protein product [Cuscuta europaea]|uniref:Uncharacterized protein n=1 Tax=Cuscuta europaea TaxID=41803 RepID=A0A9P1E3G3_CUSEU|nr:unnamed protein product [Cuscuta europaea]
MTEHEGSGRSEAMESIISRYDNLVIGEEKNEQVFEEGDDREEADNEGKACDDVVALGKPKTEERRVLDTRPAEVSEKHYGKARQLELLVVLGRTRVRTKYAVRLVVVCEDSTRGLDDIQE